MDDLTRQVADLQRELGEWTVQRDEAVKERGRLQLVEIDLTGRVERLIGEVSGRKVPHQKELDMLL